MPQLLSRLPLVGSLFGEGHTLPRTSVPDSPRAPAAIVRTGPTLQGLDLLRCFGSGDAKTFAISAGRCDLRCAT